MFNFHQFTALMLTSLLSASALAAGYEKNIMWSGYHGGVAGAGAAFTSGAEAIFYNPAGLVTDEGKAQVTFNLSPTTSSYEAPVVLNDAQRTSEREYYAVPALLYSRNLSDKIGIGAGVYVAGGSRVEYKDLDLTPAYTNYVTRETLKSEISAYEFSLGAAYKVMRGLKVGLAYRFGLVDANFNTFSNLGGGNGLKVDVSDLSGSQHGFRFGAQYAPEGKPFGFGITYRSPLHLKLKGDISGSINGNTPVTDSGDANLKTIFPQQVSIGSFYDVMPEMLRAHAEYVWTQYSRNQFIDVGGSVTLPGPTVVPLSLDQKWRDQHNIRLAGEYLKSKYPIRAGYVWSSGVENPAVASAIFAAPGVAHTFTVGTGRGNEKWDFNIAGEYIFAERDKAAVDAAQNDVGNRNGKYNTSAYAIHTGVTYKF